MVQTTLRTKSTRNDKKNTKGPCGCKTENDTDHDRPGE